VKSLQRASAASTAVAADAAITTEVAADAADADATATASDATLASTAIHRPTATLTPIDVLVRPMPPSNAHADPQRPQSALGCWLPLLAQFLCIFASSLAC